MATPVIRESYARALRHVQDEILLLGNMVEQAIIQSLDSLKRRDRVLARRTYENDQIINEKRYAIENEVLGLIATQQPMASDLRFLAAILEINTELERMGDYAKGIARIAILLGDSSVQAPIDDLELMAEKGLSMLNRSLDAFVRRDAETARSIPLEDDEIDNLYNHIHHELMHDDASDQNLAEKKDLLVWAAHNLERLADRVTNICERIVFVVAGSMVELDVKSDRTISESL